MNTAVTETKLPPRQRNFVVLWASTLDWRLAAKGVGVKETTARSWLNPRTFPEVSNAFLEAIEHTQADYGLLREHVLRELQGVAFGDAKGKMKALELLGQYLGLWQGGTNVQVNVGQSQPLDVTYEVVSERPGADGSASTSNTAPAAIS